MAKRQFYMETSQKAFRKIMFLNYCLKQPVYIKTRASNTEMFNKMKTYGKHNILMTVHTHAYTHARTNKHASARAHTLTQTNILNA